MLDDTPITDVAANETRTTRENARTLEEKKTRTLQRHSVADAGIFLVAIITRSPPFMSF